MSGDVAALLAGIRDRRPEFEAAGERAQALRTLPPETVQTLRDMGMFWLKTPAELGGTPLAPLDFCDVLEELGYTDSSTAWTVMVGNGGTGTAGGWLPDAGARRVFAPGRPMPLVVGTPGPRGTGRVVAGGYVLTGRWGFASAIAQSDWLLAGFGAGGRFLVGVVPAGQAQVVDNWRVAGLQGTGSMDFRLDEVFVPAELTFERAATACRGGALFRQEAHVFLSNEVPPLCIGVARRALDEMTGLGSERAVFHVELGRATARVRAARLVHRDAVEAAWAAARASGDTPERVHVAVAAASAYAVDICAEVITGLFRHGGDRMLSLSSPMQRYLRDTLAARQHIGVSEENYERAGRDRIRRFAACLPGRPQTAFRPIVAAHSPVRRGLDLPGRAN